PMVLKLDDLLAHLRSVREMAARLTALKDTIPGAAAAAAAVEQRSHKSAPPAGAPERPAVRPVEDLSPALQSMAARLAQDHAKCIKLTLSGLAEVPAPYAATIKDCLIQMLRNAAVHGIEAPEVRRAQAKRDTGSVVVDFRRTAEGYELLFEDDGAGIAPEMLKAAAVRRQLITEEDAE